MNKLIVLLLLCFYLVGSKGQGQEDNSDKIIISKEISNYLLKKRPKVKLLLDSLLQKNIVSDDYSLEDWTNLSDLIVIGKVTKIKSNPEGPYHTSNYLEIDSILKGTIDGKEVIVKTISGLTNIDNITVKHLNEPEFIIGEKVLLFLSKIPLSLWTRGCPPSQTGKYFKPEVDYFKTTKEAVNYFEIWNKSAKWIIMGDKFTTIQTKKSVDEVCKEIRKITSR